MRVDRAGKASVPGRACTAQTWWMAMVIATVLAHHVGAQAVTEWSTPAGLPIAVVEVAGGDVEHLAAIVPPTATLPHTIAGWSSSITARPGALVWSVRVPATVATQAAIEVSGVLTTTGCGAVVAVGPVPARDLIGPLATLDVLPAAAALRRPCPFADGREEVVRGTPERVELLFAVPQPDDPRFDALGAVAAVLERRLSARLPGVRAAVEPRQGCWWLVLRLAAGDISPRSALLRLREAAAASSQVVVDEAELVDSLAPLQRAAVMLAADGAAAATRLVERLASGGRASGGVTPIFPAPLALSELLREVLGGRRGVAVLFEAERRSRPEVPETLPSGVILTTRWLAEEIGVVALAFGGVDPATGRRVAVALATRLADAGWHAATGALAGVPTVTAVLPPGDVPEAIEAIADGLLEPPTDEPLDDLAGDVGSALGLNARPTAETLSLALALPGDAEEGVEAARKFLAQIPAGGVRSSMTNLGGRLQWTAVAGSPRIAAIVELPAAAVGWLAGEVLTARATAGAASRVAWMSPAGGLAVVLFADGGEDVPALDARLAAEWKRIKAPPTETELLAAAQRLYAGLFGDLPAAMTRAAVSPFLPAVPAETALLAPDLAEVAAALAALPDWEALLRFARGPAPEVVAPPVRKSPARPGKG